MKNVKFLFSLMIIVSFFNANRAMAQWTLINTGYIHDLQSISIGNENRLCCSGQGGTILLSDNHGESWYPASIGTSQSITQISMLGEIGYSIADEGGVYSSNDNGLTWYEVYNTGSILRCVHTMAPLHVYFGGRFELLFEMGHSGIQPIPYITGPGYWLREIDFPNHQSGYVVGDGGRAYKTPNYGYGWFLMNTGTSNNLTGVHFPSPDTGYCAGFNTTILKTTDGGISWNNIYSGAANNFRKVFFISNEHGYVSGENGTILKTVDGGQTWTQEQTGTTVILREFCYLPDIDRLLVCGEDGLIFYKDLITGIDGDSSSPTNVVDVKISPNPFDHTFVLQISGLKSMHNSLNIFNGRQKKIMEFTNIHNGRIEIAGKEMASGIFFYQILSNGQNVASGKLIKK